MWKTGTAEYTTTKPTILHTKRWPGDWVPDTALLPGPHPSNLCDIHFQNKLPCRNVLCFPAYPAHMTLLFPAVQHPKA